MKKLLLKQRKHLEIVEDILPETTPAGYKRLRVLFTGICRTDAKMWADGHRDLILPRVPGHELIGLDETDGCLYGLWPGQSCGKCQFCLDGRENLCESMKIIGFHDDGGYADEAFLPENSLLPAPSIENLQVLTFAEPVACVFHCLRTHHHMEGKRVLIYGGGVLGCITALVCTLRGADVTVVEKNEEKIAHTAPFTQSVGYTTCKRTTSSNFDIGINCCDSHIAFSELLAKIKKAGALLFFSGLKKNMELESNIVNLFHYKEIDLIGSYGPLKKDVQDALTFCAQEEERLAMLIESVVGPEEVEQALTKVHAGNALKYIIDFTNAPATTQQQAPVHKKASSSSQHVSETVACTVAALSYRDDGIHEQAQRKIDDKTKPLGALGRLEGLAVRLCCIQHTLTPQIHNKSMLVFAGDHGIVEEGVSAYPAKVTAEMVNNFLNHGAAINIFCKTYDIGLKIIDMGVKTDISPHPDLLVKKVGYGTENFSLQPAMTISKVNRALEAGMEAFIQVAGQDCSIVGIGEMGIGNTTSATAIISAVTGTPVRELAGRGTGVDDEGLKRKVEVLERSMALHHPPKDDPIALLSLVGGYEIAGMCGAILKAAEMGVAVVLDGYISTAAGLVATLFSDTVSHYLLAGHRSVEIGQRTALQHMGIAPLLDLDMRLGEGTGAAIAIDLAELACRTMCEMATFEEAGITRKQ
ncbi:nicotinate-nucleotide--dimethylbenzimidazole phosphoribosyltransferase [Desulfogranum japonicum]|uniref:nicotinate-nucleotide--dimethylbenzimidazole phosphoribosyltransferase n=1 Tax=Desulfogranum japonicum TaxID=231447 RepID=UPI00041C7CF3|nr:nicotinate-nucleotide--dimethylbenzimidazole phosphoribosyltransferase [Desulfogranum japonicum]